MEGVLEATGNFLTGVTAKVLSGTFTYKCQRLNYYYVKDTMGVRNAIMRMYNRSYPDYSYSINIKQDAGWTTYRTFLYPDEATLTWMDNDRIIARMMQQGDSLVKRRDINFEFYFKTDSDRVSFARYVQTRNYRVDTVVVSKSNSMPFELIASENGMVKMDSINNRVLDLKRELKNHHGLYNGWQAPLSNSSVK